MVILDGTVVASGRCAEKTTSKKGRQIDRWSSGKAHHPGGNIQALSAPSGVPLSVSGLLPGSTPDLTAARWHVLPGVRPYLKDLPVLAHSGHEGVGPGVHVLVKKPALGELDPDTKTRTALLRSLRYQGETRLRADVAAVPDFFPHRGSRPLTPSAKRNALLRSVRCPGERGFALLTQRWRTLEHVTATPGENGLIARAHASLCYSSTRCSRESC